MYSCSCTCSCLLSVATFSSAPELKVFDNYDLSKDSDANDFHARQRLRTKFTSIGNENVKGVWQVEIGEQVWGAPGFVDRGTGASLGTDGVDVETKHAYVRYFCLIIDIQLTVGFQPMALPGVVADSPVLDIDAAAVVASYKFNDTVPASAFWARVLDLHTDDGTEEAHETYDLIGLVVPLSYVTITITPWGFYSPSRKDISPYTDNARTF